MDARVRAKYPLDGHAAALFDLWLTYWSYGGNAGILEFEAFIYDREDIPPFSANPQVSLNDPLSRRNRRLGSRRQSTAFV